MKKTQNLHYIALSIEFDRVSVQVLRACPIIQENFELFIENTTSRVV